MYADGRGVPADAKEAMRGHFPDLPPISHGVGGASDRPQWHRLCAGQGHAAAVALDTGYRGR